MIRSGAAQNEWKEAKSDGGGKEDVWGQKFVEPLPLLLLLLQLLVATEILWGIGKWTFV